MAILTVGTYLSSVIADGLYEQRRDRVLQESAEIRADLTQSMTQLSGATSTQQQDAANAFVQNVGGGQDGVDSRDAAQIGRASCRERGWISEGAGGGKKRPGNELSEPKDTDRESREHGS